MLSIWQLLTKVTEIGVSLRLLTLKGFIQFMNSYTKLRLTETDNNKRNLNDDYIK